MYLFIYLCVNLLIYSSKPYQIPASSHDRMVPPQSWLLAWSCHNTPYIPTIEVAFANFTIKHRLEMNFR